MSDTPAAPMPGDRLAKVMARVGLCSRRDAEEWIKAGRVEVNGRKVMTPAFNVSATDQVVVDGAPLAEREGTRVWLYHKPRGLMVTEKDPEGRPTIFDELAEKGLPRVVSVGRLDINTEGLLLLTNDGGLKRVLELPATGWLRKYRVRAHGTITQAQLDGLKKGIEVDGVKYGPIDATLERDQGANVWLELALREGKNREVKNVLGALGLEVNRLIRISFGPFQLADLPIGAIEVVKARILKDQLGKRLSEEAEVDFASAMPEESALATTRGPARKPRPGTPEERTYGRGTHTTTIAKQRFRFTDRAERTPAEMEELRRQRPRPERPGSNAPRRPSPARSSFAEDTGPTRKIHFDDGREPVTFEEKTYGKKPKPGEAKGPRAGGKPSGFSGKPGGAATDGPPRRERSFGDRPRPPRGEGDTGRPARAYKPRAGADASAAPRKFGDKPRSARPPRDGDQARPFRSASDSPRPKRSFGGKPAADRSASDRPRASRPYGDKPRAARPEGSKPYAPRGDGNKPAGDRRPSSGRPRPAGGRPAGGRPAGKGGPPGKGGPRRPPRPRSE